MRRESWRQRRLNSAATHRSDVIYTAIDWKEIGKRRFSKVFQKSQHLQAASFQEAFVGPFYASKWWLLKALALLHLRLATILFPFFACQLEATTRSGVQYGGWNRRSCTWSSVQWKRKRSRLGLEAACFSSGEHILVSVRRVRREGSKTGLRLLFSLCRVRGETSLSLEQMHVDLQLSRSICHCLHVFSFNYLFLTALRDFLDMTKRPLSVSSSNKWVEIFCFSPLALLCPVDGPFIHRCLYFFLQTFAVFQPAIEVAEQPPKRCPPSS